MTRRISPWWYALPLGLAAVSVLVGGVLLGLQIGDAGRTVVTRLDEIQQIGPRTGLHLTLQAGERRAIAAGTSMGARPSPSSLRCTVVPTQGQPPPDLTIVEPDSAGDVRLEVDGRYWWPVYRVEATGDGQLWFQCRARTAGTRFAVGPWFEGSDFAANGAGAVVALAAASLGLLLATAAAVVILVLQLTRREPRGAPAPR